MRLEELEHCLCRGIEIRVEIHEELLVRRGHVIRKSLTKPAFEKGYPIIRRPA
jgi:hypothetical protein